MMRLLLVGLAVGLGAGCAGAKGAESARAPRVRGPSASEIYRVGEARYAAGAYDEAVRLWRHALLELPQTRGYDDLRHKLVLRMAYGQLMAWSTSGHPGHLTDAKQMLDRYVARHEGLHGDGTRARRERGEVYELLYQVESRLPGEGEGATEENEAATDGAREGGAGDVLAPATIRDAPDAAPDDAPVDDEALIVSADEIDPQGDARDGRDRERHRRDGRLREITVKRDRPSVDDPEMRAKLRDEFSNPFNGYVLTAPGVVEWFSARALVRSGLGRPASDDAGAAQRRQARRLARAVIDTARPELKACFEAAHSRRPGTVSMPTVQLSVDDGGAITDAFVTTGDVVDALGELCVVEALEGTTLDADDAESATIVVPLTLFVEGAVLICESRIRSWPARGIVLPGDCPVDDPAAPSTASDSPDRQQDFY